MILLKVISHIKDKSLLLEHIEYFTDEMIAMPSEE